MNDLLAGEEVCGFRQVSLEQGLAAMRRRRRSRRLARACALASLPLAFLAAIFFSWPPRTETHPVPVVKTQGTVASVAALKVPPVKFIDDEQLLALFPDRPVALVGRPGHQQLLFLDQPTARSPQPGAAGQ